MKRFFAFALLAFSAFIMNQGTFAQDRKVTILNFANATGDDSGTTMAQTTHDIIASGVRYIGSFRVLPAPSFRIGTDKTALREYADLANCEYILYGTLTAEKDGTDSLEGGLYSREDDSVFTASAPVENALDIFAASDAVSVRILTELHKTKISYGTLTIKTDGGKAKYDVYVNDVLAGSNVAAISSLPDGEKRIRVIARSGKDDGKVLFNDTVVIKPNGSTPITVSMRSLSELVAGRTDKGLLTVTSDPPGLFVRVDDGDPIEAPFSIQITPGTHHFSAKDPMIGDYYYELPPDQWVSVLAGAEAIIPLKLQPAAAYIDGSAIPEGYEATLDGKPLHFGLEGLAGTQAGSYILEVSRNGSPVFSEDITVRPEMTHAVPWGKTMGTAFAVERHEIEFKAKTASWDAIKPEYTTDSPWPFLGDEACGIRTVKFAKDKKYLYWRVEFNGKNPLKKIPKNANGEVDLLFLIDGISPGLNLHLDINTSNGTGMGTANDMGLNWNNEPFKPARVVGDNDVTGRIELATIGKYCKEIHFVSMRLGDRNWRNPANQQIGWIDFAALQDK
jgi:TolB-like protein